MYNEGFGKRLWKFSILVMVMQFCGSGYLASASAFSNSLKESSINKPIELGNNWETVKDRIYSLNAAEAELLYGAAANQIEDQISGNKITVVEFGVDSEYSREEGAAIFPDLEVVEKGTYWLDIYYLPDRDDLYYDISVNGRNQVALCPAARFLHTAGVRRVEIELQAGSNELVFRRKGRYAPKLYKIEILNKNYIGNNK